MRDLTIALLVGLVLLGASIVATRMPDGSSNAFPFAYSYPNAGCVAPNPFNGCGFSIDMRLLGVDYLFWAAFAFGFIIFFDLIYSRHPGNKMDNAIRPAAD